MVPGIADDRLWSVRICNLPPDTYHALMAIDDCRTMRLCRLMAMLKKLDLLTFVKNPYFNVMTSEQQHDTKESEVDMQSLARVELADVTAITRHKKVSNVVEDSGDVDNALCSVTVQNIDDTNSTMSSHEILLCDSDPLRECFIISNEDEELLIIMEFNEFIDLKSITIHALPMEHELQIEDASPPKQVEIYKLSNPNQDFDSLSGKDPEISMKCLRRKLSEGQQINLQKKKMSKPLAFRTVKYVAILIKSNQDNTELTYLHGISLRRGQSQNMLQCDGCDDEYSFEALGWNTGMEAFLSSWYCDQCTKSKEGKTRWKCDVASCEYRGTNRLSWSKQKSLIKHFQENLNNEDHAAASAFVSVFKMNKCSTKDCYEIVHIGDGTPAPKCVKCGGTAISTLSKAKSARKPLSKAKSVSKTTCLSGAGPKPKDPNAPKRPLNAYMVFQRDNRSAIKRENLDKKPSEIMKLCSVKWKSLTAEQRKPYETEATALMKAYKAVLAKYEQTGQWREYQQKLREWKQAGGGSKCRGQPVKAKKQKKAKKEEKLGPPRLEIIDLGFVRMEEPVDKYGMLSALRLHSVSKQNINDVPTENWRPIRLKPSEIVHIHSTEITMVRYLWFFSLFLKDTDSICGIGSH